MTTLRLKKSIVRSPLRIGFLLIPLALAFFAVSPLAQAQLPSPSPDGGYPGENTAEGDGALSSVQFTGSSGFGNTAIGSGALHNDTSGGGNTANGDAALFNNTNGFENTATGADALQNNIGGIQNTATGQAALQNNNASYNTATGFLALFNNTTGNWNTAFGWQALSDNQPGWYNTATGASALQSNQANGNTADGFQALRDNTTGIQNTATGFNALVLNTTGSLNTANGFNALLNNKTGSSNTATGIGALNGNTIGSGNIALGYFAGSKLTTGSNNIDIGNAGAAGDANRIRIGKQGTTGTFVAGIFGSTVASGVGVIVNSSGQLGTVLSSERFKDAIKPMDKASEAILALQPVTFRYKQELDPDAIPQFGLIAEEVDKVNPDLVVRGEDGKITTVRYEAVNAMLLNEFLKEHRKVEEQEGRFQKQEAVIAKQQKQIEALTTTVQKVSDQVAFLKAAPQLVANP